MVARTVQQIWPDGDAAFERGHQLPASVRKAVWALLAGRRARVGGHLQACPEGPSERLWYNACRHRRCRPCAWLQVERWLVRQQARVLAWDHDHVIVTLPDERRGRWLANGTALTPRLWTTVWERLGELRRDEQDLGARAGMSAALHTWSQTRGCHPPRPCLVTGGGLTAEGPWRAVRHGFLRPVRVVMAVCRGKLLAALRPGVAHGQLTRPEGRSRQQMANLRHKLGRTTWHVHIRERYRPGAGVLT